MKPPLAEAIVIGASVGALDALAAILPALPRDYPLPAMVVVHVPPHKNSLMASLLAARCRVRVREAQDKEPIEPGTVYLAPPDYHLLIEADKRLSLSGDEPVQFSRPSIDVLFESAADVYGPRLVGVVLTGANSDGAEGLRYLAEAGGTALVQQPESAYAPEMPAASLRACPAARSMALEEIAAYLVNVADPLS